MAAAAAALAAGALVGAGSSPASAGSLSGSLYVDTNTSINKWLNANSGDWRANNIRTFLASQPVARWFTSNNPSVMAADVQAYFNAANSSGKLPVAVLYVIPRRDCSQYSAGGATSVDNYRQLIDTYANNAGNRPTVVILETDALALLTCFSPGSQELNDRYAMLRYAVGRIKGANGQAKVYLDAGHSTWGGLLNDSDQYGSIAQRLINAGIQQADGFFTNVSNYNATGNEVNYGRQVLSALQSKGVNTGNIRQIIDTSRNGNGVYSNPSDNEAWCNPPGRKIGDYPTLNTGQSQVDALLWVKIPGESDGTCKGGPQAGTFWIDYAYGLTQGANPPQQTWTPTPTTTPPTTTWRPPTTTWQPPTTTVKPPKTTKYKTVLKCRQGKNGQRICKTITRKKGAVDPAVVAAGACKATTAVSSWPGGYVSTVTLTAAQGAKAWSVAGGTALGASSGGALAAGESVSVTLVGSGTAVAPQASCS